MESNREIIVGLVGANETNYGRWLMAFLRRLPEVSVMLPEPENDINITDVIELSDIIIFAVPSDKLEETVMEYNNANMPLGKLWIDVAPTRVLASDAFCQVVADTASLRFDEPSADSIRRARLTDQSILYVYPLSVGCSGIGLEHFLSIFEANSGVGSIEVLRHPVICA